MALVINTRSYTADRNTGDAAVYAGPSHTFSQADKAELKRVYPKASGSSKGVARPTFKLTKSVEINSVTGERADAIVTLTGSLPVGMTAAAIEGFLADIAAFCAGADAAALFKSLDINA